MSSGKGCQQPVSLCSSRRELCPWCRGKAGIWDSRRGGIPGDGASCGPHLPHCCRRLFPVGEGERAAPHPPGQSRGCWGGHGTPFQPPHHPIHGQHMGGMNCKRPPEGQAWGEPGRANAPRGKGRPPAPVGGKHPPEGGKHLPPGHPQPRAAGMRPTEPANAPRPAQPPRTGVGPTQPCPYRGGTPLPAIPPSPPHSPRGAATSPCRAGVGAAPAREGGRGREGAAAAPSVPLHVPGAGQPRKRGRGGGGGHGATSHPAAEVAGARAAGARPGRTGGTTAGGGEEGRCLREYGAVTESH